MRSGEFATAVQYARQSRKASSLPHRTVILCVCVRQLPDRCFGDVIDVLTHRVSALTIGAMRRIVA